jgi:hypothetical protein
MTPSGRAETESPAEAPQVVAVEVQEVEGEEG